MKRKSINFEISEELHKEIKLAAINKGITMNLWMHRAIIAALKKDKEENKKE